MRRRITLTAGLAGLALTASACAQQGGSETEAEGSNYPSKPIELIVGFDAGGPTDIGARLLATELEKTLDATITVVNRPAANSQVAYTAVANAEPDGYTMGTVNFPSAIITSLDESRGADYDRDSFAPIALNVVDPTAVAVAADSDIQTPEDLVEAAEANPGELKATTTGVASNEHFALAQLEESTGAQISPVHFAEGATQAATAFLGGNVEVLLANASDMTTLINDDQARVIGVMEEERSPFFPDVPTFAESGYDDVAISSSRGMAFPAGTPDDVIQTMSDAIGEIMEDEEFRSKFEEQGLAPTYMDSEEYGAYWDQVTDQFTTLLPLVTEEN